jgi:hypothetical protein
MGGSRCFVLGAWCLVLGAWCFVLCAWCFVLCALCLALGFAQKSDSVTLKTMSKAQFFANVI